MKSLHENKQGFLREKMQGYEVVPPEAVWASISSRIGGRGRKRALILAFSAAASIALAIGLGLRFVPMGDGTGTGVSLSFQDAAVPGSGTKPTPAFPAESEREEQRAERVRETMDQLTRQEAGQENPTSRREERVASRVKPLAGQEASTVNTEESVARRDEPVDVREEPLVGLEAQVAVTGESPMNRTDMPEEFGDPAMGDPLVLAMPGPDSLTLALQVDPLLNPLALPGEDDQKEGAWSVGAGFVPQYNYRDAAAGTSSFARESGMMSYGGGVQVSYKTRGRLALSSGVFFNEMGLAIGSSGIKVFGGNYDFVADPQVESSVDAVAVSNSVGNIVAQSGDFYVNSYRLEGFRDVASIPGPTREDVSDGIRQHLQFMEVPLNLRYTLVEADLELQLVGGVSANILVNNYISAEGADGSEYLGYLSNLRTVNYAGNAGVGMVYHVHERLQFRVEPLVRYFLHSVNDESLPVTRPYSFGLYSGLHFIF
ncbi:MAG: hypothetical protein R2751_02425 [Bacteroidales bacterium]